MVETQIRELLEAGVHFGHQTSRWNPKMRRFIFAERNGIHIIDLKKTASYLERAQNAAREVTLQGRRVMFVCTKRQLRGIVEQEAERSGAHFVTERWLGGMLTNFQTIKKQIRRMKELQRGMEEGSYEFYTKKERLLLDRERLKLEKYLSGVSEMARLPGALFVIDCRREEIAVREANKLGIPVIGIADTNADPDRIDFPVPGNDDAIRSVAVITRSIADAVERARKELPPEERDRPADEPTTSYSTEMGMTTRDEESRPRRRPRRRRRPRPEAIATIRGDGENGSDGAVEVSEAEMPARIAPAEARADAPPADAGAAPSAGADVPATSSGNAAGAAAGEAPDPAGDGDPEQADEQSAD
ncbi:MAG TPA: 30S ribosomal protein S2 [Longimicrobiales bacterium]|nr:30S ribosomal protein S2 [Longimicrobiales bacterium]